MKTENNKPLYKVLNEQRAQGVLIARKNGGIDIQEVGNNSHGIYPRNTFGTINSISLPDKQVVASTEYTALAVNNLHILAEALEQLAGEINLSKLNIKKDFSLINAHANALKALNRIS